MSSPICSGEPQNGCRSALLIGWLVTLTRSARITIWNPSGRPLDSSQSRSKSASARPSPARSRLNGIQPSPYLTARRTDGPVRPPIQMGGCGFWTGLGQNVMLATRKCFPSYRGRSSVHRTFMISRYSSVIVPRSRNGTFSVSNSPSR